MNTYRKRFFNQSSTAGAFLGCVARINQHALSTSILSFVLSVLCKLIPGCIRDAFRQAMVLKHSFVIQLFQCDDPVLIDQLAGKFVSKVFTAVGDALVNMANCLPRFARSGVPFSAFESFRWAFASSFSSRRKKRGLSIFSPVERVAKLSRPTSTPTAFLLSGSGMGSTSHEKQAYQLPTASRLIFRVLIFPSIGTVLHDLDSTNFREQQTVIAKCKARLRIGETVVPATASKTRDSQVSRQPSPAERMP